MFYFQVNQTIPRNESACSITENMIFSVAGFDAPQMNFVSYLCEQGYQ